MGSCASTNVTATSSYVPYSRSKEHASHQKHDCCERHNKTVTHFNTKTEDFYCLTCYQDYKRRHTRAEATQVREVPEYVSTIQFKQSEIQALDKVRNFTQKTERALLQISQIEKKLENKRSQILDEIKSFVNTVIELIRHLEEEICEEVKQKILTALNEVKACQLKHQSDIKTLTTFKNEVENNKRFENNTSRLRTVVKCEQYFKKNTNRREEIVDYDVTFKLNKYISLNDITGKGKEAKDVILGRVACECKSKSSNHGELSDISEDASDDSEFTKRSSTRQTGSTSGTVSSQRNTHDIIMPGTPTTNTSTRQSTPTSEMKATPSPLNAHTFSPQRINGEGVKDVYQQHQHLNQSQEEVTERPQSKFSKLNQVDDTFEKSQKRLQFLRDNAVSTGAARRVSYSGSPSRKTPTPRRSSQSVVSPGNITSPFFLSPRPSQRHESMEQRIAVKYREIKLPRDEHISNITDTTQLGDGKIVLCDQKNEKLLLMNEHFGIISEARLSGHPHNVTNLPDATDRIAVTIPDENTIKIVQVVDKNFEDKIEVIKLQTKPKCRGIDYVDGNLIYTTRNDVAVIRKEDKTRTWKFKYAFREPVSLSADRTNDVIFVSCLGLKTSGEVVKMHYRNEKIDFVISCSEIQHPVCSTTDKEGFIYICDIDPPSVHQITPDGRYCRRLLSSSQGKFQHVSFIEGTDLFIATENDSDYVHIYEMM